MKKLVAVIGFSITWSSALFGAEYYVASTGQDSNPGTESSPWKTIDKANSTLRAGDTVYIRKGQYDDPIEPTVSGSAGNYITYRAYPGEEPVITNTKTAINLDGRDYIRVDGINVDGKQLWTNASVDRWVSLRDSNYNIVENGDFKYAKGWSGISVTSGSHHNKVLNNRMDWVGTWDDGTPDDKGDMIDIKCGTNNLFEGNHLTHGGHALFAYDGSYNVFRNNIFNNDWSGTNWGSGVGNRAGSMTAKECEKANEDGHNVFEGNILINTKTASDTGEPPQAMKVDGVRAIVRNNFIYDNAQEAFSTVARSTPLASGNRMYHNVIYNNGGPAWRLRAYTGSSGGVEVANNVFKNNIVYGNRTDPMGTAWDVDFRFNIQDLGDPLFDNQVIANAVVKSTPGDARVFVATIGNQTLSWFESAYPNNFKDNIQEEPMFVEDKPSSIEGFRLKAGSPLIDKGAFLTTTSDSGSGTTIKVKDASYFSDGYGVVEGDLIMVGTNAAVRITKVDFGNNQLTVDRSIAWTSGAGVSLPYQGSAPDIGAYEHNGNSTAVVVAPPEPPVWQ